MNQADYDTAVAEVIQAYDTDQIEAFVHYGNISAPGISDIDLIAVFRPNASYREWLDHANSCTISSTTRKLIGHATLTSIPSCTYKYIRHLDNFNIQSTYKINFQPISYPDEESSFLTLLRLLDWIPERVLLLQRTLNQDNISLRHKLCLLNSVSYSLNQYCILTGETNLTLSEFVDNVTRARTSRHLAILTPSDIRALLVMGQAHLLNCLHSLIDYSRTNFDLASIPEDLTVEVNIPSRGSLIYSDTSISLSSNLLCLPPHLALNWIMISPWPYSDYIKLSQQGLAKQLLEHIPFEFSSHLVLRARIGLELAHFKSINSNLPCILKHNFLFPS